jgi:hypothetical protein
VIIQPRNAIAVAPKGEPKKFAFRHAKTKTKTGEFVIHLSAQPQQRDVRVYHTRRSFKSGAVAPE